MEHLAREGEGADDELDAGVDAAVAEAHGDLPRAVAAEEARVQADAEEAELGQHEDGHDEDDQHRELVGVRGRVMVMVRDRVRMVSIVSWKKGEAFGLGVGVRGYQSLITPHPYPHPHPYRYPYP